MENTKEKWIESEKYLPIFLRGEKNQERLLKALYYKMELPKMNLSNDEKIPIDQAQKYAFELLRFLADYGYVLRKLRLKKPFLSIKDEFKEYKIGKTRDVTASADLVQWMKTGEYLPDFLYDFHDRKDFFYAFHNEKERPLDSVVTGVIYTTDSFLWYLARFGYVIRKVNNDFTFSDIHELTSYHLKKRQDAFSKMIKNSMKKS